MTLHYNMYKPITFHSGLFSELRYMSNGLTFEILNGILRDFQECWIHVDTEKLTFILDHHPPSDRL